MFLDDELQKLYDENKDKPLEQWMKDLAQLLSNRISSPEENGTNGFLNSLKQIDYSWKSFCKKNPTFRADFWRNYILKSDDKDHKLKKALKW